MKDKEQDVFANAAAQMHKGFPVLVKTGVQDRAQLERLYPEGVTAKQFVTSANERVLTDDGEQGMHGKQGIGLNDRATPGPSCRRDLRELRPAG